MSEKLRCPCCHAVSYEDEFEHVGDTDLTEKEWEELAATRCENCGWEGDFGEVENGEPDGSWQCPECHEWTHP